MIGRLLRSYRFEKNISQTDLVAAVGGPLTLKKLRRIEQEAAKDQCRTRLTADELDAVAKIIPTDRAVLLFLNGQIPPELLTVKDLSLTQIRVGMAMLYAACGERKQGPAITHDLAVRMRLVEPADTPRAERLQYRKLEREGRALPDAQEMKVVEQVQKTLPEKLGEPDAMDALLDSLGVKE